MFKCHIKISFRFLDYFFGTFYIKYEIMYGIVVTVVIMHIIGLFMLHQIDSNVIQAENKLCGK